MSGFTIKRGNTSPILEYALEPVSTVLTGATVVFNMMTPEGESVIEGAAAQILIETGTPTLAYAFSALQTALSGSFLGEFEITFADEQIETFPNEGFIPITIGKNARPVPAA